jgi:HEAT repeat protein
MQDEVEFRKEIEAAILPIITLLNDNEAHVRSATVSALTKLADHGEFVLIFHLDIAYVQ